LTFNLKKIYVVITNNLQQSKTINNPLLTANLVA